MRPAVHRRGSTAARWLAASLLAITTFAASPAKHLAAGPPIIACPNAPIVCDTFNRTAANAWGTADVGGAWSGAGGAYSVTPGAATVLADSTTPSTFLASTSVQDVDLRVLISPPAISNQYVAVGAAVRYGASTGTWYQVDAYYATNNNAGNYSVQLVTKPDNVALRPDFQTNVPGGSQFWLRVQAQGVSPTTVRWKLWPNSSTEPPTWSDGASDGNAPEQTAGGVGVVSWIGSGSATVAFNSVQATAPVTPTIVPCPPSPLACDSFNRTTSGGWGTADVGGPWTPTGAQYAVTPGSGSIVSDSTTPSAFLTSLAVQDVDVRTLIAPPPLTSHYVSDGVAVRYAASTGSWYQLDAYYASGSNNGNYTVQLMRKPDNTLLRPEVQTSVPGGTPYWLRLQAQGVNPTTLRWKLWASGSAEPPTWGDVSSDGNAAQQVPGGVGVVTWVDSGTATVAVDSVQATAPTETVIACPSGTFACDSFNRSVTNGWGTADVGGAWSASGPQLAMTPGRATIVADNTTPSNFLTTNWAQDIDMLALISPPPMSASQTDDDGIAVRYVAATGSWYQLNAYYSTWTNNGHYVVQLKRKPDNALIRPEFMTAITGGTPYWLRFEAQGVFPTTLRWKMWPNGSAEPATWTDSGTDSHAAQQVNGGIGVVAFVDNGTGTVAFNSVHASVIVSPTPTVSCTASTVLCDTFARTVGGGWGAADVGGPWSVVGTPANWSVAPGTGLVNVAPGAQEIGSLGSGTFQDVEVLEAVTLPTSTQSDNELSYVLGRYTASASPTYYRVGVGQGAGPSVTLRAQRSDGSFLGPDANTGIGAAKGVNIWLRVQFQGTYPTAIRARAWKDGSAEPTNVWMIDTTDSTAAEQGAGLIGIRDRNEDTAASHTFQHDGIEAVAMTARGGLCPAAAVACDTFNRTVTGGWGTADTGGVWNHTGSIFSVTPGQGLMQVNSTAPGNWLPSVSVQDVDALLWVSVPSFPGGTGDAGIAVRYVAAGGTYYQVSVYYPSSFNGGNYVVQLKRKPENVLINPDFSTSIPGGTAIWIRMQAQGVSPTTLRWKIWQDGLPEPAAWTATGTDNNPAEQGPGGVGIEGFTSGTPVNIPFNNLSAKPIGS